MLVYFKLLIHIVGGNIRKIGNLGLLHMIRDIMV